MKSNQYCFTSSDLIEFDTQYVIFTAVRDDEGIF